MGTFDQIDIRKELEAYDLTGRVVGNNLMACCPYHGEKNPSFGVNVNKTHAKHGQFNCLSCGERGNFYSLVAFLEGLPYKQIKEKYEKKILIIKDIAKLKEDFIGKIIDETTGKIKVLKSTVLEKFKPVENEFLEYLLGRGLTLETIRKFDIRQGNELKFRNRVIVPIFDEVGRLISMSARSILANIDKKDRHRKLIGTDTKKVLFGMNHIKKGTKIVVLVEGEMDTMWLHQYGYPALGIQSIFVENAQIRRMLNFGVRKIYLMLDGDKMGKQNLLKVQGFLSKSFKVIPIDIYCDPDDLTEAGLKKVLRNFIVTL